ncbi:hypothetical protein ACKZDW_19430 [Ralstonia syzygii subsp. celebesensis]|uniref:Uncharacterized protein n=5 Tax=Ralstonia solanacearum species complex TaxID=3116862 RepID=A0AAD0S9B3_RALSL|nr:MULTISPECIES: hypothetical protein [Ralstonia solanacearum species complex]CAH0445006.1 hypothetical protein LMG10661_01347 [Ralstonia syzygii subsp. syzygii]CCA80122.1 conserved hypothethical protein [blood disease bacterium R229]BEU73043.1 hypothetical protein MAFF211271_25980 [Ralstonia pseudosolanacearum]AMP38457.1 hypothetical protein LBM2029_13375 [Ralstonia solanacearum]AQW29714.1 hypothetical protein B0B51_06720 [blood disease bacterium A2-HR MARDI]
MKPQKQTGSSRAHLPRDRAADADADRAGHMPMRHGTERSARPPMRVLAKDGRAAAHAGQLPQNQQRLGQHQNSRKQP